jgi:uncharacterized protein (DUF983 family)
MITRQTIHNRNWMTCPRCDGGKAFTAKDIKQGAQCTYCDSKGEVPRNPRIKNIWFGFTMNEGNF